MPLFFGQIIFCFGKWSSSNASLSFLHDVCLQSEGQRRFTKTGKATALYLLYLERKRTFHNMSFKIWQSPRQTGAFLYLSPPPWGQEAEILLVLLFSGLRIAGRSRELWCMADYVHTLKPDWLSRFIASRLYASVVVWFLTIQQWKQSSLCSSELSLFNVPE